MPNDDESAMSGQTCLYLYGVIQSRALNKFAGDPSDFAEMSFIDFGEVACAVATVAADQFHAPPESGPDQLAWVAPRAMRHHQVLQRLMSATTVVPLKFGTLCATSEQVCEILRDKHDEFAGLLTRFQGMSEWSVRIYADEELTRRHLRATDPQARALADLIAARSGGEAYLLGRKMQQLTSDLAAERFTALAQDAYDRLQSCVALIVPSPPSTQQRESSLVEVTSAAVLVTSEDFAKLELVLDATEREYSQFGVAAEMSGPWPPYSFSGGTDEIANFTAQTH